MFSRGQGDANFHSMYIVRVASRQQENFEILLFSGGWGDAHFHSMYIVRVASRQREKLEILVFSGGQGDANFHSMYIVHSADRVSNAPFIFKMPPSCKCPLHFQNPKMPPSCLKMYIFKKNCHYMFLIYILLSSDQP